MNTADDPERLLAEALRAHAVAGPLAGETNPTDQMAPEPGPRRLRTPVGWLLLFALLLGLAAGAVAGVLSMI